MQVLHSFVFTLMAVEVWRSMESYGISRVGDFYTQWITLLCDFPFFLKKKLKYNFLTCIYWVIPETVLGLRSALTVPSRIIGNPG